MFSDSELRSLLPEVADIAERAAQLIMEIHGNEAAVRLKADRSPVTEADERAEELILGELERLAPGVPAVGEEAASRGQAPDQAEDMFWLVDALDGTKEFISRNGEFTVNIALVRIGRPVLGVVLAPALAVGYRAAESHGAQKRTSSEDWQPIRARSEPEEGVVVVSSRSHGSMEKLQELLRNRRIAGHETCGSSLKFCLLAEGKADIYPRYGRTAEWDTAAGHGVLAAAGGCVRTLGGEELAYGKPGWLNPEFIAHGIV